MFFFLQKNQFLFAHTNNQIFTCYKTHKNHLHDGKKKREIPIRWYKENGQLSSRAEIRGYTLYIANVQIDDSGVYVCEAKSGSEIASQRITITIGGE